MSTGDVIDRAVRLYRRNFTPLVSIAAVPSIMGYVVSLLFWFGLAELERGGSLNAGAAASMMLGAIGYPLTLFVWLMMVAGLSRVVGDQVMLDEPITFRRCVAAIRRRFKDILFMGLLSIVTVVALYMAVSAIVFALILVVGIMAGVIAAAGLPPTVIGVLVGIVAVIAIAAAIFLILVILVRVTFLPQVVMLEGQSAGNALTRAISLGKGNWHRLGAIVLFGYFVSFSLLFALLMPIMAFLYMSGLVSESFFAGQSWNAIYGACSQVSNLLVFPIWIISLTLLYFDSRVRKEAYDLELLAREIAPGFYWQPPAPAAASGYQGASFAGGGREFVQTSPLGLAGYGVRRGPDPVPAHQVAPQGSPEASPQGAAPEASGPAPQGDEPSAPSDEGRAVEAPARTDDVSGEVKSAPEGEEALPPRGATPYTTCARCGAMLEIDSRFCNICGATLSQPPA